jgi:hypothetical protein
MNKNHLRQLIRTILEAAFSNDQAASKGLALMIKQIKNGLTEYTLYDPKALRNFLAMNIEQVWNKAAAKSIIGTIVVSRHYSECWDGGEVVASAAESGYGPMMYELAMQDYPGGLFSDRDSVSNAAKNVWKKFDQRTDVEKLPFDDIRNPKTPPKEDDCKVKKGIENDYLNQSFKTHSSSNLSSLLAAHEAFLAEAEDNGLVSEEVQTTISDLSDTYFNTRYAEGL